MAALPAYATGPRKLTGAADRCLRRLAATDGRVAEAPRLWSGWRVVVAGESVLYWFPAHAVAELADARLIDETGKISERGRSILGRDR